MNKKYTQWFWFIGGFALGFTLISIGHAALPKKVVSLTELKTSKVGTPELEQDFSRLASLESRYAESSDQQKRLKTATAKNARRARN
jgi:hypothetical protein